MLKAFSYEHHELALMYLVGQASNRRSGPSHSQGMVGLASERCMPLLRAEEHGSAPQTRTSKRPQGITYVLVTHFARTAGGKGPGMAGMARHGKPAAVAAAGPATLG